MATPLPYALDDTHAPALGLITLQADETIEQEFRHFFAPEACKLHITRVPSAPVLTPASIAAMATDLPTAASLLPTTAQFRCVAYACTSGTAHIGAARVHQIIRDTTGASHATDPMTATRAALTAVGAKRIAIVSPYTADVAAPLTDGLADAGLTTTSVATFGEAVEANVARISAASLIDAARHVAHAAPTDAVFLSCTNLQTRAIIAPLEAELGIPVISSNTALAWHMARLAGVPLAAFGQLRDLALTH